MHITSYFNKNNFSKVLSIWVGQLVIYLIAYFIFNQQLTIIPPIVAGMAIATFHEFRKQYNFKVTTILTFIIAIIGFALLWAFAMTITKLTSYFA